MHIWFECLLIAHAIYWLSFVCCRMRMYEVGVHCKKKSDAQWILLFWGHAYVLARFLHGNWQMKFTRFCLRCRDDIAAPLGVSNNAVGRWFVTVLIAEVKRREHRHRAQCGMASSVVGCYDIDASMTFTFGNWLCGDGQCYRVQRLVSGVGCVPSATATFAIAWRLKAMVRFFWVAMVRLTGNMWKKRQGDIGSVTIAVVSAGGETRPLAAMRS